jgi:hypothetical protein
MAPQIAASASSEPFSRGTTLSSLPIVAPQSRQRSMPGQRRERGALSRSSWRGLTGPERGPCPFYARSSGRTWSVTVNRWHAHSGAPRLADPQFNHAHRQASQGPRDQSSSPTTIQLAVTVSLTTLRVDHYAAGMKDPRATSSTSTDAFARRGSSCRSCYRSAIHLSGFASGANPAQGSERLTRFRE